MPVFTKAPDNTWHGTVGHVSLDGGNPMLSGKPWVKVNNIWVAGTVAYRKVAGVWQEIYPMLPGVATSLSANPIYRNDRIEIDFTWTAPVSGFTTTYYVVSVYFNGAFYNSYTINAPFVAPMTLTNVANSVMGFQPYAGQGCTFSVQCFTANNVGGTVVSSQFAATVPNLPTPPTPTGLAVNVTNNDLTESWQHVNDNRTSYFRLEVMIDGATTGYNIAKAANVSTAQQPYASNSMAGGSTWSVRVAAVGVNGLFSAWTPYVTRPFAGDPELYNQIVWSGTFQTAFAGRPAVTSIDLWYQYGTSGAWNYWGQTTTLNGGVVTAPGSNGWARDNVTQFRWLARCNYGADHGRVVGGVWCKKMAYPYIIHAQDTATWNGGVWQGNSGGTFVFQGWATDAGYYWGYGFYGQQFYDQLNAAVIGYRMSAPFNGGLQVWMVRDSDVGAYGANFNGPNTGVQLRFWMHDARNRSEHTQNFYNQWTHSTGAFNKGDAHFAILDTDYFYRMRDAMSWGIGIYDSDSTIQYLPPNGTSLSMFRAYGHGWNVGGETPWAIYVYHEN